MTFLSDEWIKDEDGVPHRKGARVVVISSDQKVLLIKGHDAHDPNHRWWFTVGGGIMPEESPLRGAVRELREETGIESSVKNLVGPVLYRQSEFRFSHETVRQDEWFFLLYLNCRAEEIRLNDAEWTEVERKTLDHLCWFGIEELRELSYSEAVYPLGLPWFVEKWIIGWDGTCQQSKEY